MRRLWSLVEEQSSWRARDGAFRPLNGHQFDTESLEILDGSDVITIE